MCLKVIQTLLSYIFVCVVAFEDDIYVYGQVSQEIIDQGRTQYQLLQERGNLPKYGICWKAAIAHVEEGCRNLSEETQSDIALAITNCFLQMAGHETYNCELDKKPNLRGICINSMSDRAFNVYTEFYTHTQNICWFLRGQIWYETITENTLQVGKKLEVSARNQEEILESQRESLSLQKKLLKYGQDLEKIMEDFYISTKHHQELLTVMSGSLGSLQAWLIGEMSWFDLIMFYVSCAITISIFTSCPLTASARLPILILLVLNLIVERLICAAFSSFTLEHEIHLVQKEMYVYIWWSRKVFLVGALIILFYKAYTYRDINHANNVLLQKIYEQNVRIFENVSKRNSSQKVSNGDVSIIEEIENGGSRNSFKLAEYKYFKSNLSTDKISLESPKEKTPISKIISGRHNKLTPYRDLHENVRYNLRSRQETPDSNI